MARTKLVECKGSLSSISDAISELQSLGEECREVCDGMSENLHNGQRYQDLDASASALESISEPDVPVDGGDAEIKWTEGKRRHVSRALRRDNAVACLQAAKDEAERLAEENRKDEGGGEVAQASADALDGFAEALGEIISEAEGCEFPGMYG